MKHHMTRIMAKLGVRNRTEAAMLLRGAGSPAAQPEKGGRGPLPGIAEALVYRARPASRAMSAAVARRSTMVRPAASFNS